MAMGKKAAQFAYSDSALQAWLGQTARQGKNTTVTSGPGSIPRRNWVQPSALMVQTL